MPQPKPKPTLEHGHRALPQYLGEPALITDPRPNPRMRRSISEEDHPGKARVIDEWLEKYRKARGE